jgi:hypothetical protein
MEGEGANSMATMWEYKIEQPSPSVMNKTDLDKLGAEGWELVAVCTPTGSSTAYYFKRAKAGAAQANFG